MKSLIAGLMCVIAFMTGCQPQTTGQKIENKAEDAAHEVGQGAERAGEKINDATK